MGPAEFTSALVETWERPRCLVVTAKDDHRDCHLELLLSSAGDPTTPKFVQGLDDRKLTGDTGRGWITTWTCWSRREGSPMPSFDEY